MSKIYNKIITAIIIILVLCCTFSWSKPQIVFANGPRPASYFDMTVSDYPDNAVYVDILVKMDKDDEKYSIYNDIQGNIYKISKESEIAKYNKDGFVSYSFHFKNASSDMMINKEEYNRFAYNNQDDFNYIYNNCRKIKAAILDKDGSIIKITQPYILKKTAGSYLVAGAINYNASQNKLEGINIYQNFMVIFLMWLLPLILTLITEGIIAVIFRFNKIWPIVLMNLFTNLSLSYFITFMQISNFSYLASVVIGEILVYGVEFLVLTSVYDEVITKKVILRYTIIANTSSLAITLLINWLLIFK